MTDKDLLWVEVGKTNVWLKEGPSMPEPDSGKLLFVWGNGNSFSRREFARWSGITFPGGPGIYAVRVKLGILRRYRKVTSEEFVAAKHRTARLEEVQ